MGNACCGGGRNREIRGSDEAAKAIRAANAACNQYETRRRPNEQGRFIRRTGKWIFGVCDTDDNHSRLELFAGPIEDVEGGNWKWLQGDNLMGFDAYSWHHGYNCFLYRSYGTLREHVSEKRLPLGREREAIVASFLPDILAGLKTLGCLGLYHTGLSWDVVEIGMDGRAKIGSLEYLMDEKAAMKEDLADVRHLPPESLRMCARFRKNQDIEKMECWIVGSLLLEILLHKHVSGVGFALSTTRPRRSTAKHCIKENVPRLPLFLDASNLTQPMQDLIKGMLTIDVRGRISLDEAIRISRAEWSAKCRESEEDLNVQESVLVIPDCQGIPEEDESGESIGIPQRIMEKCVACRQSIKDCVLGDESEERLEINKTIKRNCAFCKMSAAVVCEQEEDDILPICQTNKQDDREDGQANENACNPIVTEPDDECVGANQLMLENDGCSSPGSAKVIISIKFSQGNKTTSPDEPGRLQIEGIRCDDTTMVASSLCPDLSSPCGQATSPSLSMSLSPTRTTRTAEPPQQRVYTAPCDDNFPPPSSVRSPATESLSRMGKSRAKTDELERVNTISDVYQVPLSAAKTETARTGFNSSIPTTPTLSSRPRTVSTRQTPGAASGSCAVAGGQMSTSWPPTSPVSTRHTSGAASGSCAAAGGSMSTSWPPTSLHTNDTRGPSTLAVLNDIETTEDMYRAPETAYMGSSATTTTRGNTFHTPHHSGSSLRQYQGTNSGRASTTKKSI